MTIDLSGKTILVTGAGRGIGQAITSSLLDAGATVAAHFGSTVPTEHARCAHYRADLASIADVAQLFTTVEEDHGRIDGLVLNAGVAVSAPIGAGTDAWLEAWDQTMRINLRATEYLTRRMIDHTSRREGIGRIVYIASRAAFRGDTPDYLAYAASKAGMVAIARSVARGCGREGLRSFVVAPGFTLTDMAAEFIDEYGEEYATRDVATERLTEPEDIAPTVTFLLSGYADHATGATIDINAASYVR
jgi:3-oxoacyl-[acyl-carrier protein] reductase